MKLIKKILSALMICTMLMPTAVLAENEPDICIDSLDIFSEYRLADEITLFDSESSDTGNEYTEALKNCTNYIVSKIKNYEERPDTIDISTFNIPMDQKQNLFSMINTAILIEHPELFYASGAVKLNHDQNGLLFEADMLSPVNVLNSNGTVTEVYPYRISDDEEIQCKQKAIDAEYEKIKAMIDDSMTPLQQILTVHDYIAANYEYDTIVFTDERDNAIRTLDRMVEEKKGVCQGYSYLFKYVLDKLNAEYDLGIECVTVPSNACNHMWNKVKLDGEWYNVDVTHDDPIPDGSANINHSHFLLTDEEIKDMIDNEHTAWNPYKWDGTPVEVSDSSTYRNSVLHNITKQTIYKNGVFYCFDNENNICAVNFDENLLTPVYTDTSRYKWYVEENSYYTKKFSVMVPYKGDIYFNSPNSVIRYNPENKTTETVYSNGSEDSDIAHIYGLKIKDDKINIEYAEDYQNNGISKLIPISVNSDPTPDPDPEPEMPCSSEIKTSKDDDGNLMVTVTVNIPEEYAASSTVYVAEYDINGVLTGIREVDVPFAPDSNTAQIKAFIWGNGNTPLADAESYLIPQAE